jgi:chromosome partitioning protein
MQTILVINSKGGSGKTTVATNLASYYAHNDFSTALMDYDPQGSSIQWLKLRPLSKKSIHGANAARQKGGQLRSWQMKIPANTNRLVIDAPAGIENMMLQEMVRAADRIVIPVAPSAIDIHATADFIKDLFLVGKVRASRTQVAVIANRVRNGVPVYKPLEKFLNSLKIPFVTVLTDSAQYVQAAGEGLGVFEMDANEVMLEQAELMPLIRWLEPSVITTGTVSNNASVINCRDRFSTSRTA